MTGSDVLASALEAVFKKRPDDQLLALLSKGKNTESQFKRLKSAVLNDSGEYTNGICSFCGRETRVCRFQIGCSNFLGHALLFGPQKGWACRSCMISYLFLVAQNTNQTGNRRLIFAQGDRIVSAGYGDSFDFWQEVINGRQIADDRPYVILWGSKLQDFTGRMIPGADADFILVNVEPKRFIFVNRAAWLYHLKNGSKWEAVVQDGRISDDERMILKNPLGWEDPSKKKKKSGKKSTTPPLRKGLEALEVRDPF